MLDWPTCHHYHQAHMVSAIGTYPGFERQVQNLARQHRKSNKDRLRLAVYFAPPRRAKRDIFLFEVIDGFGNDTVDSERNLFEFGYGSTPAFPLAPGTSLRMVLTNPNELNEAVRDDWKGIEKLRAARQAGTATVIYADSKGKRLWELIR